MSSKTVASNLPSWVAAQRIARKLHSKGIDAHVAGAYFRRAVEVPETQYERAKAVLEGREEGNKMAKSEDEGTEQTGYRLVDMVTNMRVVYHAQHIFVFHGTQVCCMKSRDPLMPVKHTVPWWPELITSYQLNGSGEIYEEDICMRTPPWRLSPQAEFTLRPGESKTVRAMPPEEEIPESDIVWKKYADGAEYRGYRRHRLVSIISKANDGYGDWDAICIAIDKPHVHLGTRDSLAAATLAVSEYVIGLDHPSTTNEKLPMPKCPECGYVGKAAAGPHRDKKGNWCTGRVRYYAPGPWS